MTDEDEAEPAKDRQERILDAVLELLAQQGITGVSMRSVAREAGVAVGLMNYHYTDKAGLIRAALLRIGEQDLELVRGDPARAPEDRLRDVLRRVVEPRFLTTRYLALRLQLWSLAQVHEEYAAINAAATQQYRSALSELVRAARPDLSVRACDERAEDIDVVQNGIWLTALIGLDVGSLERAVARCEDIALGP